MISERAEKIAQTHITRAIHADAISYGVYQIGEV